VLQNAKHFFIEIVAVSELFWCDGVFFWCVTIIPRFLLLKKNVSEIKSSGLLSSSRINFQKLNNINFHFFNQTRWIAQPNCIRRAFKVKNKPAQSGAERQGRYDRSIQTASHANPATSLTISSKCDFFFKCQIDCQYFELHYILFVNLFKNRALFTSTWAIVPVRAAAAARTRWIS
jgi:hypothetical protein